jgi:predicted transcriptional regulator
MCEEQIDLAVLTLLLEDHARPWSDDEVAREVGDRIAAVDSLARLYGAGLVHQLGGFVFATRPALRGAQLSA